MIKYFRKRLERIIDRLIQKRIEAITTQIREEAKVAIDQIKKEIEPAVTRTTEVFLTHNINDLQTLTQNNLQMFKTQISVLNAVHARIKGLIKILEPHIMENLEMEVERRGFMYEVEIAFADLNKRADKPQHPAVIEQLNSRLGQLYQQAQNNGWVDIYVEAVARHGRDWRESNPDSMEVRRE